VVIFSSTFDEHLERLELVLKRFRENGLKLKPSKCTFGGKKVQCLGHIISDEGIETDPDKIDKVRSWPQPTNVRELKAFMGLAKRGTEYDHIV
jgi:hypothetical protein